MTSQTVNKHELRYHGSPLYSDLRSTSSLEHTKYQCIDCHCSAVTMPVWSAMWPVRQQHPFSWAPCSFCLVKYLAMCCCNVNTAALQRMCGS